MSFPSNVKATNDPPVDKKQQKIITKQNKNKTKLILKEVLTTLSEEKKLAKNDNFFLPVTSFFTDD